MPDPDFVHPFSPEGWQDPYPSYAWLAEHDPLHVDPHTGAVLLTRHADCDALLRHRGASTAQHDRGTKLPPSMLTTDPPEHTRLRAIGARLINPASVEALRADVDGDVDRVVARLGAVFDAYDDVGLPLATRVLARLLDVRDDELAQFGRLAQDASVNLDPMSAGAAGRRAAATLTFYLRSRLAVSERLRQWVEGAGCSEAEAAGVLSLCVIGGLEPLAVVVSVALVELATPSGRAKVVHDVDLAVEDVLRLHTPIPFVARAVHTDLSLPSGTLPAGCRVLALIDSANRDAGVVADQAASASRHLSFGAGPHFCLGAPLVRMVVSSVLVRCAALPITAVDEPRSWAGPLIPRRLQPLHLRLAPIGERVTKS